MKKCTFALLGLAVIALAGCIGGIGWESVSGSGQVITETRAVSRFNEVSVAGGGELTIEQGDVESLTIETDDNLAPLIESRVSNEHLSIGPTNVNLRPSKTIQYRLKVKDLSALNLSGSIHASMDALKTERLALRLSGSGQVSIPRLEAKSVMSMISGSGSVDLGGAASKQEIHISGSGSCRSLDLRSRQADINVSGSGHVSVAVTERLNVNISGSGAVDYAGNPKIQKHISGSGKVHQVGDKGR